MNNRNFHVLFGIASHAPGCGKTTAADYLVGNYGFMSLGIGDLVKIGIGQHAGSSRYLIPRGQEGRVSLTLDVLGTLQDGMVRHRLLEL